MKGIISQAFKMIIYMTILTGLIYPLLITFISQVAIPHQAGGSLVIKDGKVIGSSLLAQQFQGDVYFWPRPSAVDFDPVKPSGGSNLGPTSKKLKDDVAARMQAIMKLPHTGEKEAPSELVYASGSGLDPHISVEAALFQSRRVAAARSLDETGEAKLNQLITSLAEGNQWGFLGSAYINVLTLNQTLDQKFPLKNSMIDEEKPNPDELLKAITIEEKQKKLGKLKLFFGMSAGVGKTYAMLEEAQQKLKEGVDVVVGVVNTHGRKETEAVLKGLPLFPEKWVKYKDAAYQNSIWTAS